MVVFLLEYSRPIRQNIEASLFARIFCLKFSVIYEIFSFWPLWYYLSQK